MATEVRGLINSLKKKKKKKTEINPWGYKVFLTYLLLRVILEYLLVRVMHEYLLVRVIH